MDYILRVFERNTEFLEGAVSATSRKRFLMESLLKGAKYGILKLYKGNFYVDAFIFIHIRN